MTERTINAEDIKKYLTYSKEIYELESSLYESGDQLSQGESKINRVVEEQNTVRFDGDDNDLFRNQLETTVKIMTDNYKNFGFDSNLYFDLIYNLLLLEYERFEKLIEDEGVSTFMNDIGITDHLKGKVKALLDHEKDGSGCCQ